MFFNSGSGIKIKKKKIQKLKKRNFVIFTFIGRLLVHKGLLEFLEAAQKIIKENTNKNVFFNIVGSIDELNISSVDKKLISKFKNNKKINFRLQKYK